MGIRDQLRSQAKHIKGPVKIHGSNPGDCFLFDPESALIEVAGAARRTRRVPLLESGTIGSPSDSSFATAGSTSLIKSWDVSGTIDAGWHSRLMTIETWMDVSVAMTLKTWVQWPSSSVLTRYAVMQGSYTWARSNSTASGGVTNTALSNVMVQQPAGVGLTNINHEVTLGTIAANVLQAGDILGVGIQRLGTDGSDNSTATLKLARYAWLEIVERRK